MPPSGLFRPDGPVAAGGVTRCRSSRSMTARRRWHTRLPNVTFANWSGDLRAARTLDLVAPPLETQNGMSVAKIVILNWNGVGHLRRFCRRWWRQRLPAWRSSWPTTARRTARWRFCGRVPVGAGDPSGPQLRLCRGYNRALKQVEADLHPAELRCGNPPGWLEPLLDTLDRNRGRGGCFAETDLVGGSSAVRICRGCRGRLYRLPGLPLLPGGRILRTVEEDRGQYDDARTSSG